MQDNLQSADVKAKNSKFFREHLKSYSKHVAELATYQNISAALTAEVDGLHNVLDIGNGGVFDYDTSVIGHVTGLDLFLDELPPSVQFPPNVSMEAGDALRIPKHEGTFDGVVMVMLLHHLVGDSGEKCLANLEEAVSEAFRVLQPGGKLVIVESCVPGWFYRLEGLAFHVTLHLIKRFLAHPPAFQYTASLIADVLRRRFSREPTIMEIEKKGYVLQFGLKIPAHLTPVRPFIFSVCKP